MRILRSCALLLLTVALQGCKTDSPTAPPPQVVFDHWGTQYHMPDGSWYIVGWCRNGGGQTARNVHTWGIPAPGSSGDIAISPPTIPAGGLGQWTEFAGNGSDPGPSGGRALNGSDVTIWWDGGYSGP